MIRKIGALVFLALAIGLSVVSSNCLIQYRLTLLLSGQQKMKVILLYIALNCVFFSSFLLLFLCY